jgi:ABC-2 type transport system permease protein
MNWRSIGALAYKDALLFFRNRFFLVITVAGLVGYTAIYLVMPSMVEETLRIGIYGQTIPPSFQQSFVEETGLEVEVAETEEALKDSVSRGEYAAGVALPADFVEKLRNNETPGIQLYVASDSPDEVAEFVNILVTEMVYLQTGQSIDVDWQQEVLGPDMVGSQVPLRDRMRSLFAVLLLVAETFGLASLISDEVEKRTAMALLATPMTVADLFAAKGFVGTFLAFGQALLFLALVRGMGDQPLIIVAALLMGGVLVSGVGFLMASVAKDFLSVAAWGVPIVVLLSVPAIAILSPGASSDWIKIVPSYYLIDTIYRVSNFGAGWSEVWANLLILLGFNLVIFPAGVLALRRKFR